MLQVKSIANLKFSDDTHDSSSHHINTTSQLKHVCSNTAYFRKDHQQQISVFALCGPLELHILSTLTRMRESDDG